MTFVEKTAAEWPPFLALAPHIQGLRCRGPAARRFLIALRALPVHLLGVVDQPVWADGAIRTPAEFICHDLDHARYKIRQDLLALGHTIPDVTPETPAILEAALPHVRELGDQLWALAPARLALARVLFEHLDGLADLPLTQAGEWLLFEIVHEKSFPLDRAILLKELSHDAHVRKLRKKWQDGFYHEARAEVFARLEDARRSLRAFL